MDTQLRPLTPLRGVKHVRQVITAEKFPRRTRLQFYRNLRGISQQQIADALDVSVPAISKAERRRGAIDQEKWYKVADLLQVDCRSLQGFGDDPPEMLTSA